MPIDTYLTTECADPVTIPERDLSRLEIERNWSKDRKELVVCKNRNKGLNKAIRNRDEALSK